MLRCRITDRQLGEIKMAAIVNGNLTQDTHTPELPTSGMIINTPQSKTSRLTKESLTRQIHALYTGEFSICHLIVLRSQDKISLTHADHKTPCKVVLSEIEWVGQDCEKWVIFRNDEDLLQAKHCSLPDSFIFNFWNRRAKLPGKWIERSVKDSIQGIVAQFSTRDPIVFLEEGIACFNSSRLVNKFIRHPQENQFNLPIKIEQAICYSSKDYPERNHLIFDGHHWMPMSEIDFKPYHSDPLLLQRLMDGILKDRYFMKIAGRIGGVRQYIFEETGILALGEPADICIKSASIFQDYECKESIEEILLLDLKECLDDLQLPSQAKKQIKTSEDIKLFTELQRLIQKKVSPELIKQIEQLLSDFKAHAPGSSFKEYLIDNYYDQVVGIYARYTQRLENKKLMEQYAKLGKEMRDILSEVKSLLQPSYQFEKALPLLKSLLLRSHCCLESSKVVRSIYGHLAKCLYLKKEYTEALLFVEKAIKLTRKYQGEESLEILLKLHKSCTAALAATQETKKRTEGNSVTLSPSTDNTGRDLKSNVEETQMMEKIAKLCLSVKRNNIYGLKGILDSKVDPNLRDKEDATAMHYACQAGYVNVMVILEKYGARMDIPDRQGRKAESCLTDHVKEQYLRMKEKI